MSLSDKPDGVQSCVRFWNGPAAKSHPGETGTGKGACPRGPRHPERDPKSSREKLTQNSFELQRARLGLVKA
jgi:hypothetical protein